MIDPNRIRSMMESSLADSAEGDGVLIVKGTINNYAFNKQVLAHFRDDVVKMLDQLDDSFMDDAGGGMSLMNMVATKNGEHWGEQPTADALFAMANGLGLAHFSLPREMWHILPGSMPYVTVMRSEF